MLSISLFSGVTSTPSYSYVAYFAPISVIIAAIVTFLGVIYSKNIERKQAKVVKLEEFSDTLFRWVVLMDQLFIYSYDLKWKNSLREVDTLSIESLEVRSKMGDVLNIKGKYLLLSSLYSDVIKNKEILEAIEQTQDLAIDNILLMLKTTDLKYVEDKKKEIDRHLHKMRSQAKELMRLIKH